MSNPRHTVSALIQARSACFRLRHRGNRYVRLRSPTKLRLEPKEIIVNHCLDMANILPSSTEALICSSSALGCCSEKLRTN